MWLAKSVPYSKSNSSRPLASAGMASTTSIALARFATAVPNSSSTSMPAPSPSFPLARASTNPSKISAFVSEMRAACSRRRDARDAEQLLLERAPVVERQHVEISVVAQHSCQLLSSHAAPRRPVLASSSRWNAPQVARPDVATGIAGEWLRLAGRAAARPRRSPAPLPGSRADAPPPRKLSA